MRGALACAAHAHAWQACTVPACRPSLSAMVYVHHTGMLPPPLRSPLLSAKGILEHST